MENLKPNADKTVWDRELSVPSRLIEYVDQGVRASESVKSSRGARC